MDSSGIFDINFNIISDFSPEKSSKSEHYDLNADLVLVASNPGQSTRIESSSRASYMQATTSADCLATLTLRDLSPLAIESMVLGLMMWEVKGVVIVAGDPPLEVPCKGLTQDWPKRTTQQIRSLQKLIQDHKNPANPFVLGSVVDLSQSIDKAANLAGLKVKSGAEFFITQPIFSEGPAFDFETLLMERLGGMEKPSIYYGLQLLEQKSLCFSIVPDIVKEEVERETNNLGSLTALAKTLIASGHKQFYTIPPIFPGGQRNYQLCRDFNLLLKKLIMAPKGQERTDSHL